MRGSTLFQPRPKFLVLVIGWHKKTLRSEVLYDGGDIAKANAVFEAAGTEFAEVKLYRDPRHHSRRVPTGEVSVRKQFAIQHAARVSAEKAMQAAQALGTRQPAPASIENVPPAGQSDVAADADPADIESDADAEDLEAEDESEDADDLPEAFGGAAVDSDTEEKDAEAGPTETKTYKLKNNPRNRR